MKKEAFLRVKRGKEYNTTKVSDICREAEISRGTFYAHFSNISEVLDVLLNEALSNMEWYPVQDRIDRFIKGGVSSFAAKRT